MLHALLRLLLFGVLGAMTTVAVAWWCGWRVLPDNHRDVGWGASSRSDPPTLDVHTNAWIVRARGVARLSVFTTNEPWTEMGEHYQPLEAMWPWWVSLDDLEMAPHFSSMGVSADALAQGWPVLALWCESPEYLQIRGGILISTEKVPDSYMLMEHVLAFRPIWRGFAANTVIYGLAWCAVLLAPGAVRRAHRRRRNRCVRCGYDRRGSGSGRCPECGAPAVRV